MAACELSEDSFWREERARLIGTHPGFPDAAHELGLSEAVAHAFVLVLSRLPRSNRHDFADVFLAERSSPVQPPPDEQVRSDPRSRLAIGASIALLVAELAPSALMSERVVDLLTAAAQGDDLTATPPIAVAELRKTIARIRLDIGLEDWSAPDTAAAFAIAEVLDPAGDSVAVKEVAARAAWAAVESWPQARVLGFLLEVDRILDVRSA